MKAFYIICVLIWLAGCASSPTHHSLSKVEGIKENLLPPRDFVARMPKTGGYSLSPDGTKMAYWERSFMVPYVSPTPLYIENLATGQLQKYSDLGGAISKGLEAKSRCSRRWRRTSHASRTAARNESPLAMPCPAMSNPVP